MYKPTSPEQHLTTLMAAVEHELLTHGAASLAAIIVNMADIADTDDNSPEARVWRQTRDLFDGIVNRLPQGALPALGES